ncbi:MAG: acetate--CoA ligase family protein [Chloroflexi bacterium]|nr:acetate--CoA ligase family protein [Chloroflexota bacterium]
MTRLHEYQGKDILRQFGIPVPKGAAVATPNEARLLAIGIGGPVVIKAQAWVTGRAGQNLIHFADSPDETAAIAADLLGRQVGNFRVDRILVEERLKLTREFYVGVIVDDAARAPVVIFSSRGGTGIEVIAAEHPDQVARQVVDIRLGLREFEARDLVRRTGIDGDLQTQLAAFLPKFYTAARTYEARTAEINPLALTASGELVALDARFTIDDYAVYRHPDLGIEIAREFDRPPTDLEKIAWNVEKNDYRGTFYFIQMQMDFRVYRAARIILSQQGIDGYYAGGSGVASQEQFHSARGLVKAFMDEQLNVPAVLRVGGNAEDQAKAILLRANGAFPAPIEAYGRDDSPDSCVERLQTLVDSYTPAENPPPRPPFAPQEPYSFATVTGGTVTYDHAVCRTCVSKACVQTCVPQILSVVNDVPVLNIAPEQAKKGGCTECLACEVECHFLGNRGGRIFLPIAGLPDVGGNDVHSD